MAIVLGFARGFATLKLLMRARSRGELSRLSVIVAVGDVEDTVGREVRDLALHLRERRLGFQILALGDGSHDTSLTLLQLLSAEIPELSVLGSARPGHAFRRAMAHTQGEVVLLWEAGRGPAPPHAIVGWALSRLGRKDAVIVRGRCIFANRIRALPVLLHVHGHGDVYEARFERRALSLRLDVDIVGKRARRRRRGLLAPVLRILSV